MRRDYKRPGQRRTAEREAAKTAGWNPARAFDEQFDDAIEREPECWLAQFSDRPCSGRLVRAHLIPRQVLLRELRAEVSAGAISDRRSWVPACGGPQGDGGHHGMLDRPAVNELRVPRSALPPMLEVFAAEHGLSWFLDRCYGPREQAA